jgi:hypothetical protein
VRRTISTLLPASPSPTFSASSYEPDRERSHLLPDVGRRTIVMTVRPPRMNSGKPRENVLDYEIAQEQAAALGRMGRALEAALAALSAHDERDRDNQPTAAQARGTMIRQRLLQDAGNALWCFIVQREACGLRDQRAIMREYRVPREVQNRMGTFGAPARGP